MAGSLGLINAANARDLGGYPTADGRRVRRGLLYRASALHRLTEADVEAVRGLRLACLIDLRHPAEVELIGANRLPTPPPGRVLALPLLDPEHDIFGRIASALARGSGAPALPPGGTAGAMVDLYRWFVTAGLPREVCAAALRLIASPDGLPLMFHCTAGKDRTGWLAALVLSVLGVDRELIVDDYLRTNELNAEATAFLLSRYADKVADPGPIAPLFEARREYLEAAFAEVDRLGGMDAFVRDGLGLSEAVLADLRTNLLD